VTIVDIGAVVSVLDHLVVSSQIMPWLALLVKKPGALIRIVFIPDLKLVVVMG
jgi:hypothetical protein